MHTMLEGFQRRQKIVVLAKDCPFPHPADYKARNAKLIELLLETMDVELLCFRKTRGEATLPRSLLPDGLQVTWIESTNEPLWKRALKPLRPDLVSTYCPTMVEALRARALPNALLWISRMEMGPYVPVARKLGYRVILDEQNAVSTELLRKGFSSVFEVPSLVLGAQYRFYEKDYCDKSHAVVAASAIDASRLHKLSPSAPIHVIPDGIDGKSFASIRQTQGDTLLFLGPLNNEASIEGLNWFVAEVLPRIRGALGAKLPRIVVAGAHPDRALKSLLQQSGVEVCADPQSSLPHLAKAAVVMFPFRRETEARFKILEAMAAGRAVLSTPKGAEGLTLSPSYDIWLADQPDSFASALVRLFENEDLRQKTAFRAMQTVERIYDWQCTRDRLQSLISSLMMYEPTQA